MNVPVVLGLDIGGANLKAATADRRAVSTPFALWKQPDKLPAALAELVAQFPDADEFAVTMTGELCDCYETKRDGVNAILDAVLNVSRSRPVWVWTTDGVFAHTEDARRHHMKVAAANWHALATWVGRHVTPGPAVLLDIGSTTTDVIPLEYGGPRCRGRTDPDRLNRSELLYIGVRRTPVCAVLGEAVAAELFATMRDVYLVLGWVAEDRSDTDTADGRPATRAHAHARLSRMTCGDPDTVSTDDTFKLAEDAHGRFVDRLAYALDRVRATAFEGRAGRAGPRVVLAGSGEFLGRRFLTERPAYAQNSVFLDDILGPVVSACAPAFALAVLGTERRP